jgi:predicted glycosyltransferase
MSSPEVLPATRSNPGQTRIALYSHDTMGLGHMRRNLLIAQSLTAASGQHSVLLLTGAFEAKSFAFPPNVDCITLPALYKTRAGAYEPRRLGVSLDELLHLRVQTLLGALRAFEPDVFIVDKEARGALGELDPALEYLRHTGRTYVVLGIRDVLDEPEVVRREWAERRTEEAIRAYYDAVWIYGDPMVYDAVREYDFSPDVAAQARFTGYLDPRQRSALASTAADPLSQLDVADDRIALCTVGGGQDGASVALAFAASDLPPGTTGVLVAGPFMPADVRERLHATARQRPELRVVDFTPNPDALLARADRVISMGGYNNVCELLASRKKALVVPRVTPRREQWIRAERLAHLGVLDVCHPDELCPEVISRWLVEHKPRPSALVDRIDLGGLQRIPTLVRHAVEEAAEGVAG